MAHAVIVGPAFYRTRCTWPPNQLPEGVTVTYADHPDIDNAIGSLELVHTLGYGGQGKVFPLEMYIIEPTGAEIRVDYYLPDPTFKAADMPRVLKALNNPEPLGRCRGYGNHSNEKNETTKPLNRRERRAEASRQRRAAKRGRNIPLGINVPIQVTLEQDMAELRRKRLPITRASGGPMTGGNNGQG